MASFVDLLSKRITNLTSIRESAKRGHKPSATQIAEIIKLRNGPSKLEASSYHWYALSNDALYHDVDLTSFGGNTLKHWLHNRLNDVRWEGMVTDKLVLYGLFEQFGIPYPEVYAAACRFERRFSGYPVVRSADALADLLRTGMTYPCFSKPVKGGSAIGAMRAEAYDATNDEIALSDGRRLSIQAFVDALIDPTGFGFLFQEAVLAAEDTRTICGDAVSGVRFVMLRDDSGAYPFRVIWKVPRIHNHMDNYVKGKSGNMVASVDRDTGRVVRVVSGAGIDLRVNPPHPDTGAELVGMQLPGWNEALRAVTRAAEFFPGFRFQHWDVGLTSRGPVMYELNSVGDIDLVQIADGKGVYDEELRAFVQKYGNANRASNFIEDAKLF